MQSTLFQGVSQAEHSRPLSSSSIDLENGATVPKPLTALSSTSMQSSMLSTNSNLDLQSCSQPKPKVSRRQSLPTNISNYSEPPVEVSRIRRGSLPAVFEKPQDNLVDLEGGMEPGEVYEYERQESLRPADAPGLWPVLRRASVTLIGMLSSADSNDVSSSSNV